MSDTRILAGRVVPEMRSVATRDRIFVRDLVLDCHIGVYPEEKGITQRVSFTVEAVLAPSVRSVHDQIAEVPSYDDVIKTIRGVADEGHINLVETFAERIAERCLVDRRIVTVLVRVEKLERGPRAVGVEITRPVAW